MRRSISILAAAALAALLAACASIQKLGAANDVHALLVAIRDDDQMAFEAHVDRKALRKEIEARLVDRSRKVKDDKWGALGALLAPAIAQLAGDALVQPHVFRSVAEYYGYKDSAQIPGPLAIAGALKTLPDGRICATKARNGPCLLIFTHDTGVWRLSGFEGDISMLRIKL